MFPFLPIDEQVLKDMALDAAIDSILSLTKRVEQLEKQFANAAVQAPVLNTGIDVKSDRSPDEIAKEIQEHISRIFWGDDFGFTAPIQYNRKDIIEKAIEDVEYLVSVGDDWSKTLPEESESPLSGHFYSVEFFVNRAKRTVVAKVDSLPGTFRGIAKCDPEDVFNVHIGKAIAIHRALGLEVPKEYVRAPWPTELEPGYVVRGIGEFADQTNTVGGRMPNLDDKGYGRAFHVDGFPPFVWLGEDQVVITDDSKE